VHRVRQTRISMQLHIQSVSKMMPAMSEPCESIDPRDITLAILAGGAGSRMGAPKGSLQIHGRPILEFLLDQFAWTGPTILVLAPGIETPDGAERFGRVVCDPIQGLGPLRGVLTALENSATEITVVATVDMPGIENGQLMWLVQQLAKQKETLGVMSKRSPDQIEPFPSAFRLPARMLVDAELRQGKRSVHGLLKTAQFAAIPAPDEWNSESWINLNTPTDLRAFLQK
jgi:molybdenum cofactor guanylyltransferase